MFLRSNKTPKINQKFTLTCFFYYKAPITPLAIFLFRMLTFEKLAAQRLYQKLIESDHQFLVYILGKMLLFTYQRDYPKTANFLAA